MIRQRGRRKIGVRIARLELERVLFARDGIVVAVIPADAFRREGDLAMLYVKSNSSGRVSEKR